MAAAGEKSAAATLTDPAEDFPRWYQEVVARAELADNGPVRGTMVIRPWGYGIWERLQRAMDERIKEAGAQNAYFPLFIPDSFLKKEAEHVEGFSPELAVVTHGGGKELEEPVVVRPTSETVFNYYFAKWIQSHRDLPMLLNQWANVVRWEMRPRLFLRTTEFLWQEGHTAHATEVEARDYALYILKDVYRKTMEETIFIPVLLGHKTEKERFAGATRTWTTEGMMGDGKALQMGTSHELGQNFAKAFGTQFSDQNGQLAYPYQTSWGTSTRLIGSLIMAHGDAYGLRLPPALSPYEVVVVVVRDDEAVHSAADQIAHDLRQSGVRVHVDGRCEISFGRRSIEWELKGVPIRVEVGPRDLAEQKVTVVLRHLREKEVVSLSQLVDHVRKALSGVGPALFAEALARREANTHDVSSIPEAAEAAATGFARLSWEKCGPAGEALLSNSAVSVRCLQRHDGSLATSGDEGDLVAIVARSY